MAISMKIANTQAQRLDKCNEEYACIANNERLHAYRRVSYNLYKKIDGPLSPFFLMQMHSAT